MRAKLEFHRLRFVMQGRHPDQSVNQGQNVIRLYGDKKGGRLTV
jgi:hypothetical protein